jgi:hypothetical protein
MHKRVLIGHTDRKKGAHIQNSTAKCPCFVAALFFRLLCGCSLSKVSHSAGQVGPSVLDASGAELSARPRLERTLGSKAPDSRRRSRLDPDLSPE